MENETIINRVMQGMELGIPDTERAAIKVGVPADAYRLTRKLIILLKRQTLSAEEETIVKDALKVLELTGRIGKAKEMTEPILTKHWDGRSRDGRYQPRRHNGYKGGLVRDRAKQQSRFENTMFAIREACTNNEELVVPELTVTERREATEALWASLKGIATLIDRIKGGLK